MEEKVCCSCGTLNILTTNQPMSCFNCGTCVNDNNQTDIIDVKDEIEHIIDVTDEEEDFSSMSQKDALIAVARHIVDYVDNLY